MDYKMQRFYDELSAAIVLAGGVKFNREQLEHFTLKEIVELIYPNGITLHPKVNYEKEN